MSDKPTKEQVYDFIIDYIRENQMPPTRREIQSGVGVGSVSTVNYHLESLQKDRRIKLRRYISRGIYIL